MSVGLADEVSFKVWFKNRRVFVNWRLAIAYSHLFIALQLRTTYNIICNARMTTFQSLVKTINLKQLISTLNLNHRFNPLPFYVLKVKHPSLTLPENSTLSLTRKVTDQTLSQFNGPLSVWSPHHLHRISETRGAHPSNRIILKNPFKSQELIIQALVMGVTEMALDSREQFLKIESLKSQSPKFKNTAITYHWLTEDHPENIQELLSIKNSVRGLFFPREETSSLENVETITRKVLQKGVPLRHIICEGQLNNWEQLRDWQKRKLSYKGIQIEKSVDLIDASEVQSCVLATRLRNKRLMVCEEARELIRGIEHNDQSLLVEHENQQWLLSALHTLPMDQEKYLFDVEKRDGANDLNTPKPFIC